MQLPHKQKQQLDSMLPAGNTGQIYYILNSYKLCIHLSAEFKGS